LLSTGSNLTIEQKAIQAGLKDMLRHQEIVLKETSDQTFKDAKGQSMQREILESLMQIALIEEIRDQFLKKTIELLEM